MSAHYAAFSGHPRKARTLRPIEWTLITNECTLCPIRCTSTESADITGESVDINHK
ncbi:hypothetical protein [Sporosarcina sp. G11-34]|uniref:hypothetical protein n=1 Tax=Sporosarcina sp. G11-34 TaxID=2849605 RepID=UPI0022A9B027|nr:hypothetical protein [Sporosarcina sp. G11-34]